LHTQLVTRLLADHSLWTETTEGHASASAPETAAVSDSVSALS